MQFFWDVESTTKEEERANNAAFLHLPVTNATREWLLPLLILAFLLSVIGVLQYASTGTEHNEQPVELK